MDPPWNQQQKLTSFRSNYDTDDNTFIFKMAFVFY